MNDSFDKEIELTPDVTENQRSHTALMALDVSSFYKKNSANTDNLLVSVAGWIEGKLNLLKFDKYFVILRDMTGSIKVQLTAAERTSFQPLLIKGTAITVTGKVCVEQDNNATSQYIIKDVVKIENAHDTHDSRLREKESSLLTNKIVRVCSNFLDENEFLQFESNLISTYDYESYHSYKDEGLSALDVVYTGFGAPAKLIVSPAKQVSSFMFSAMKPRAYTVATSFTSSYRFPSTGSEMKIIVAKATDIKDALQFKTLMKTLTLKIFANLAPQKTKITISDVDGGVWDNSFDKLKPRDDFACISYLANIPIYQAKNDSTRIEQIIHLQDTDGRLLLEGSREVNENLTVSTLTIYPTLFLSSLMKNPLRVLRNLWSDKA